MKRALLFGRKDSAKRRVARPYGTRPGDWPANEPLVREFDEVTDEEAERLSSSVGASGARRPPSE